jgi:ubiquinone/menaquinone biosynthesis C-methylase UbiE
VFLDIACGAATASAEALKGTHVGRYIGIDISQPSLDVAKQALGSLDCPIDSAARISLGQSTPGTNQSM